MDISGYDEMDLRELTASGNVNVTQHINLTGTLYGGNFVGAQVTATTGFSTGGSGTYEGYTLPATDGSPGQVMSTNGSKVLSFIDAGSGSGDVSSTNNITDNAVVRGDGGSKGVQTSLMSIADNGDVTMNSNGVDNEFILRMDTTTSDKGDWRIRINDTTVPGLFFIEDFSGGSWVTNICIDQSNNLGINTVPNPNTKFHVFEYNGKAAGANQGSILLEHDDSGGKSSIVFKSKNNSGGDYGYIEYSDDGGPQGSGAGERGQLVVGVQNDANRYFYRYS